MLSLMRYGVAQMKRGSRRLRRALRKLKGKNASFKLWLEPLEDRTLMAVSITGTVFQDLLVVNGQPDAGEGVPGIVAYLDTQAVTVNGTTAALTPPPQTVASLGANGRLYALQASGLDMPVTDVNVSLNVTRGAGAGTVAFILLSPAGVVYGASAGANTPPNNAGARLFGLSANSSFNGTVDDQAAGAAPGTITGTITSTIKPSQLFSATDRLIYQGDPNGTWYLAVDNTAGITINSWSLTFREPAQVTTTDANGNYSFSDLTPGAHQVGLAIVNPPAVQNVVVGGAQPVVANFAVVPPPAHVNVALSNDEDAQQQPSIAVDPTNMNHVVITYMDYSLRNNGFAGIAFRESFDGGTTWSAATEITLPAGFDEAAGYAKAVFDKDGNLFISFMAATFHGAKPPLIFPDGTRDPDTNRLFRSYGMEASNGIFVARRNAGQGAFTLITVSSNVHTPGGAKVFFDAIPDIVVDTSTRTNTDGNVYVTWTRMYPAGTMPGVAAGNGGSDIMVARMHKGATVFTTLLTGGVTLVNHANRSAAFDEGGGLNTFSKITVLFTTTGAPNQGGVRVAYNNGGRYLVALLNNAGAGVRGIAGAPALTAGVVDPFLPVPQGSVDQVNSIFSDLELYPDAPLHNFPTRGIIADPFRQTNIYAYDAIKVNQGLNTTTNQIDRGEIVFAWSLSNAGNVANFRRTLSVGGNAGNESEVPFNNLRDFFVPLNDDNDNRYIRFDQTLEDEVVTTQAQPMLAIDALGRLVAIWLDNRRDPEGKKFDIYGSVSTDGGLTWSANFRITDEGFDPESGEFTDARNNLNAFMGDSLGLATAGGFVYAAWTDTRDGNQNIYFSKFGINPGVETPNDRFEGNNSAATATDMGDIGAEQNFPKLLLTPGEEDWFLVSPQGGKLFASIQGSAAVQGLQFELFNGAQLLAGGTDVMQNGQFVRKEISQALAAGSYLLKVSGATATTEYSLRLNSLTADLGTTVYASSATDSALAGTIGEAGSKKLYAVTAAVAGSIEIDLQGNLALIPRVNGEGAAIESVTPVNIIMEIIAADGTVLDSFSVPSGTTVVRRRVAVEAGQNLLISLKADDSAVPLGRELSGAYSLVITNLDLYQTTLRSNLFFATGATPTDLAVADLNNDGRLDLIAATTDPTSAATVLRGTGLGVFWGAQGYKAGAEGASREIVVDKFNGAGDLFSDVVVSNFNSADISLLTGLGDTTLAPERRSDATARALALAVGDFNGDGFKDLVVLERTPAAGMTSNFSVILGRGDGTFGPPEKTATTLRAGANVVLVGDVNGDGRDDIVVLGGNEAVIEVHVGNGNGTFQPGIVNASPEGAAAAAVADVNGDGRADIIVGGQNNGRVYILTSAADGTFGPAQSLFANTNSNAAAASISSIVIADAGRNVADGFLAAKDGIDDIIVVTIPRVGSEGPHINFLAGTGGGLFAAAQRVRSGQFTGPLVAGDFNNDGEIDLAAAEEGGIRAIYGSDITFPANTTMAAARNLGDLKHIVTPVQAISPLVTESWFRITVPTDVAGSGDQVLDFSALFQNVGGAGLGIEVRDAQGNVLASGTRFRISAAQGSTLFVRVFSVGGTGFGTYTMSIDVLPQVVGVQALTILPGVLGQPNGPVTSLLITLQGDRLDRATAEDRDNYRVTWLGADGIAGTSDDRVIALSEAFGAVIYNQGANVNVSSGRSFPASTRQTITLNFDDPLFAGSYLVEIVGIQTDDFNSAEDGQLVSAPGITGHSLVSLNGGVITEGAAVTVANLVQPAGTAFNYNQLGGGTAFLTQLHDDLGALLDGLLAELGDVPDITTALTNLIQSRLEGAAQNDTQLTFAILWFDPVSISLEDPQGARTTYNLQTNTLVSSTARTYIEVGGNVQVIVMAGVSGTFQVNVSDVQNTARGGAAIFSNGKVETVALTDAMRSGTLGFEVNVPPPPPLVPAIPGSSAGAIDVSASALIDSSVATLATIIVGLGNVSTPDLGATDSEDSFVTALRAFVTTLVTQWPVYSTEVAGPASNLIQFMSALETVADSAEAIAEVAWTNIEQTLPGAREFGDLVEELAGTISRSGAEVGEAIVNSIRSRLTTPPQIAAPGAPKEEAMLEKEEIDYVGEDFGIVDEADLPMVPLREADDAFLVASLFAAGAINQAYRPQEKSKSEEKKNRKDLVPLS